MRPDGDGFVAVDLLGRDRSMAVDWLEAEELLEELGIGYLADAYLLRRAEDASADGERGGAGDVAGGQVGDVRVRIIEVSTAGILVKRDDFGDVTASLQQFTLSWPMPDSLRPMSADELRAWSPW
jgi:hypothetical protein